MTAIHYVEEKSLPKNCYVFKHSTRCPVSFAAADRVKNFKLSQPLYWINVVEQRELSNWVATTYSVEHHSPQLIKIVEGNAVNSWTHGGIREDVLE
jgi:bacillithiol system protein YtxJ